jgi:hypothetical protein
VLFFLPSFAFFAPLREVWLRAKGAKKAKEKQLPPILVFFCRVSFGGPE